MQQDDETTMKVNIESCEPCHGTKMLCRAIKQSTNLILHLRIQGGRLINAFCPTVGISNQYS